MTSTILPDHIAFINSVELAKPRYSLPEYFNSRVQNNVLVPPDNKKEGYVVAGGLTAFTENVSGQAKQDILNATLLAQLASDRKYDRENETLDWYGYYNCVLGTLGFEIQDFEFVLYETSGTNVKMDEVVIKVLAEISTEGESAVITATLDAMRKLSSDDKKIKLFDKHGSQSTFGNFQVYSCDESPDGEISLSLGAFYFKAMEKDNNFFFYLWESSCTMIYCGKQRSVLDSEANARLRSAVSAKLGDNAVNLVASIDI